jgi:hypothetical protein
MLSEFQPLGVTDAARRLGLDPFEVVRLLVAADKGLDGPMQFTPELVEELRTLGRIDPPWWADVELPEDANPLRQRVRAALQLLLDKGVVGDQTTRMDNLWRGLPFEDQGLLQQAVMVLAEEGSLRVVGSPIGLLVAVEASAKDTVAGIAAGTNDSAGLTALYQG